MIRPFEARGPSVCLANCSGVHCSRRRWLACARRRRQRRRCPAPTRSQAVTLANGMQIIVWPDHDIPNVALFNWVHVGSRNEVPGITGLAHFFEHMMFNGTSTRPQGEFDRVLEANGARNNAFTSSDVTVYQDWMPRDGARDGVRSRGRSTAQSRVRSQGDRERAWRRATPNGGCESTTAFGRLQEQVQATAYLAHPYGIPTIGWPSDIESWCIEDLKTFFATDYAPNNCTLVLVGDVEPKTRRSHWRGSTSSRSRRTHRPSRSTPRNRSSRASAACHRGRSADAAPAVRVSLASPAPTRGSRLSSC